MSSVATALAPPPPGARGDLIAALGELRYQANDIRKSLREVNDEEFRPKIEHALDVTEGLLRVYLPEPNDLVLPTLRSLYFATQNIRIPVEDTVLEGRTETLEKLRAGLGRLRYALDEAWKAANIVWPGRDESIWQRGNDSIVSAGQIEDFEAKVATVLAYLDALQAAVDQLGRERDTAPRFVQQGRLVTFYTETMTVEIDVARLQLTVNETNLDVGALVDTIEQIRENTEDFRITVQAWVDDVTNEILTGAETLNDGVRRLVSGVRALGGMIGAGVSDAPDMVLIPSGRFMMGIPFEESKTELPEGREIAENCAQPQHEVTINRPFLLGRCPVTVGEYAVFATETNRAWARPDFPQTDHHPAVYVGYSDAVAYVEWLSERTGDHYRLPSEAEWEYACITGNTLGGHWVDEFARLRANFRGTGTTEVGAFPANPWGLLDMLGNAFEWVEDRWHDNYKGAPRDGSTWTTGPAVRVQRGGSWNPTHGIYRACYRFKDYGGPSYLSGFRLARTL